MMLLSRAVRASVAVVVLVGLLVGVPAVLAGQLGWPLPTTMEGYRQLTDVTMGVSDELIVGMLAVIVWVAWLQLAVAVLAELAAATSGRRLRRLPLLPGTQPLAARLVAAALLITTAVQPRLAVADLPLNIALTAAADHQHAPDPYDDPDPPSDTRPRSATAVATVTVGPRDSWWQLAETHLGDGLRWREIRALNLDRQPTPDTRIRLDTEQLHPGWQLLIPTNQSILPSGATPLAGEATGQDDRDHDVDAASRASAEVVSDVAGQPAVWEVRSGEHFWHIAEQTLTEAWGRPPTVAETTGYWQQLVDANLGRLAPPGDPNLIHPGQRFHLPESPPDPNPRTDQATDPAPAAAAPDPATATPERAVEPAVTTPVRPDRTPTEPAPPTAAPNVQDRHEPTAPEQGADDRQPPIDSTPPGQPATPPPLRRLDGGPAPAPPSPPAPARDSWQARLGPAPAPQTSDRSDGQVGEVAEPAGARQPLAPGLAAAALAAAGVLALLRRRRRAVLQRRPPGLRLPTPAPETVGHINRLAAAAADTQTLGDLAELLATIPDQAQPQIVTLADDGTVRLLFDNPAGLPDPPDPWELDPAEAGPVGWHAQLGQHGQWVGVGLPLLVTLGRTDDGFNVCANLAGIATLAVAGQEDRVRRVLRSLALECATSRTAGYVEAHVAGDRPTSIVSDQLRNVTDHTEAIAAHLAEQAAGIITEDRIPRLLIRHPNAPQPQLPEQLDGLLGLLTATTSPPEHGWALTIDTDTTARLQTPDGHQLALTLPELDPQLIDDELDRLTTLTAPQPPDPQPDDPQPAVTADDPDPALPHSHGPTAAETAPPEAILPPLPPHTPARALAAGGPSATSNGRHPAGNGHRRTELPPVRPAWCEVRLLGPVEVRIDGRVLDGLSPLTLQLALYLATHRDGVTVEKLEDALWAGRAAPPDSQRVRSVLTKLRDALGDGPDGDPLLPRRAGRTDLVRLTGHVTTDLDQALELLERARPLTGDARTELLDQALTMVRGEPFEGLPLSWATETSERAIVQLQDAATDAATTHRQAGRHRQAETAITAGLKLSDPYEPLYLEWARLEADRGRHHRIPRIRQRLHAAYSNDQDDDTEDWTTTPTPETSHTLTSINQPR
jgi:DNA-binding SARP family transcriptional activator